MENQEQEKEEEDAEEVLYCHPGVCLRRSDPVGESIFWGWLTIANLTLGAMISPLSRILCTSLISPV